MIAEKHSCEAFYDMDDPPGSSVELNTSNMFQFALMNRLEKAQLPGFHLLNPKKQETRYSLIIQHPNSGSELRLHK